jgi:transposase InsO family protein
MVVAQMVVDAVVLEGRSLRDTARTYGVSKSWVAELVRRYREGGEAALVPQSKRPKSNPRQMSLEVEDQVVALRKELLDEGADAGAETIQWHLAQRGDTAPSVSAIHRALTRRGFITAQPRKRPKSSYVRFEADLPNECWQGDMTHWQLADGAEVEIINFIDDHSRFVVAARACVTVKATDVRASFEDACARYGTPASVLTDNGAIFNAKQRRGRSGFESDLLAAGVLYKHSSPYHPQTCGKVERWHQTLKGFLDKHPADTLDELQDALDHVIRYYNEQRPHRSCGRRTPLTAYQARSKALPHTLINQPHYRLRKDIVDPWGKITLRYSGRILHVRIGHHHRGKHVRLYIIDEHIRVVDESGEFLGEITIDPNKNYQTMARHTEEN